MEQQSWIPMKRRGYDDVNVAPNPYFAHGSGGPDVIHKRVKVENTLSGIKNESRLHDIGRNSDGVDSDRVYSPNPESPLSLPPVQGQSVARNPLITDPFPKIKVEEYRDESSQWNIEIEEGSTASDNHVIIASASECSGTASPMELDNKNWRLSNDKTDTKVPETIEETKGCDTSFGTIDVLVTSARDLKSVKKGVSATIAPLGTRTISVRASGSYIGMIGSPNSERLLRVMSLHPCLEFEGFIPNVPLENGRLRVYIDVYGRGQDVHKIGKSLSKEKLYLQDSPRNGRGLFYENPHILQISSEAVEILDLDKQKEMKNVKVTVQMAVEQDDEISKIFDSESLPSLSTENLQISDRIKTKLMTHQMEALAFMLVNEAPTVRKETPSIWKVFTRGDGREVYLNKIDKSTTYTPPDSFRGGILADEMGLGKSLSILSLIATSLDSGFDNSSRHPTLIITPKSTISSWEDQIKEHTRGLTALGYVGKRERDPDFEPYDIVFTTFGVVAKEDGNGPISRFAWRRVVLDEAHTIRRRLTKQAKSIYKLNAERRWCLTGTPIQNELDDYGSLLEFLRVKPVHTRQTFSQHIIRSLRSGDKAGFEKLQALVSATTLRRTKDRALVNMLPDRRNEVHNLKFSKEEDHLYNQLNKHTEFAIDKQLKTLRGDGKGRGRSGIGREITQLLLRLRQVCDHGPALLPPAVCVELAEFENGSSPRNFSITTCCELCGTDDDSALDSGSEMLDCQHLICETCLVDDLSTLQEICPLCSSASLYPNTPIPSSANSPRPPIQPLSTAMSCDDVRFAPSTKVLALLQNLQSEGNYAEKSVVFSCWTKMLHLVATALENEGVLYERLDGSMNFAERKQRVKNFQNDEKIRVLLASIGSGSVGIDLTVASRVHLLEPQFNPMAEEQALARIHRIGQTKPVVTVRYIMEDSYEERIQTLQRKKLQLAELCCGGRNKSVKSNIETLKHLKEILR